MKFKIRIKGDKESEWRPFDIIKISFNNNQNKWMKYPIIKNIVDDLCAFVLLIACQKLSFNVQSCVTTNEKKIVFFPQHNRFSLHKRKYFFFLYRIYAPCVWMFLNLQRRIQNINIRLVYYNFFGWVWKRRQNFWFLVQLHSI